MSYNNSSHLYFFFLEQNIVKSILKQSRPRYTPPRSRRPGANKPYSKHRGFTSRCQIKHCRDYPSEVDKQKLSPR